MINKKMSSEIAVPLEDEKIIPDIIQNKITRELKKFEDSLSTYTSPETWVEEFNTRTRKLAELYLINAHRKNDDDDNRFSLFSDIFNEPSLDWSIFSDAWDGVSVQTTIVYLAIAEKKNNNVFLFNLENVLNGKCITDIYDYDKSSFFPKDKKYIILYQSPQEKIIKKALTHGNVLFKTITRLIEQRKWCTSSTESSPAIDPPENFEKFTNRFKIMNLLLYMFGNLSNVFKVINLV